VEWATRKTGQIALLPIVRRSTELNWDASTGRVCAKGRQDCRNPGIPKSPRVQA
jgi:hypothetical protein